MAPNPQGLTASGAGVQSGWPSAQLLRLLWPQSVAGGRAGGDAAQPQEAADPRRSVRSFGSASLGSAGARGWQGVWGPWVRMREAGGGHSLC